MRLVNSGTEATMSAIRLARGFTGRDVIVKFAGNYHGHVDSLLVAAGSSAATLAVPNSPGVTAGTSRDTLVLQYNDVAGLEAAFAEHGGRIAGVIFEPVVGNMGVVVPSREFLQALRQLTRQHGALLICDEVMTGFRVAYGGAQQLLGIEPDLTTLGKIVGGGCRLERTAAGPRSWITCCRPAKCFRPARSAAIRWRRRPASRCFARCAMIRRTSGWSSSARDWKRACAKRRRRRACRISWLASAA